MSKKEERTVFLIVLCFILLVLGLSGVYLTEHSQNLSSETKAYVLGYDGKCHQIEWTVEQLNANRQLFHDMGYPVQARCE